MKANLKGLFVLVSILSCHFSVAQTVPIQIQNWLFLEQTINNRDAGDGFTPLDFSAFPSEYDPKNQPVWDIGYIEIPENEINILKSEMSPSAQEILLVPAKRGQVAKVRFFLHPYMESQYAKEIYKYGLKRGQYFATPTSSPRSLVIWKKNNPDIYTAQKVSLDIKVGGLTRINSTSKLMRAFAVSQAMRSISAKNKKRYGFDVMTEPMVAWTMGKSFGNITRDLGPHQRLIPGFSLASTGPGQDIPLLIHMINKSSMSAQEFIESKILRPLISAYAYLTFAEGLIGEPHQQNVLFDVNGRGQLTGKVIFRDLDAYKADLWLRHLQGRPNHFFSNDEFTAKDLNVDLANEAYGNSFLTYIRDEWTYLLNTMLKDHLKALKDPSEAKKILSSAWVEKIINKLFLEQAREHLGPQNVPAKLNGEEVQINKMVLEFKNERFDQTVESAWKTNSNELQTRLANSYMREFIKGRATSKTQVMGPRTIYSETPGMIIAINMKTRSLSFGLNHRLNCSALFTVH